MGLVQDIHDEYHKLLREQEDNLIRELILSSCSKCEPSLNTPTEITVKDIEKYFND